MRLLHKFRVLALDRLERRRVLSHTAPSAALAFDIAPRINLTAEYLTLHNTHTTPAVTTSTTPARSTGTTTATTTTTHRASPSTVTLPPLVPTTTPRGTTTGQTTTTVTTTVPTTVTLPTLITLPNTSLPLNATNSGVGLGLGLGRIGTAFGVGNGNSSQFNPAITTPFGTNAGFNSPANFGFLNLTDSAGATGLSAVPGYNPVTIGYNPNDTGIGSTTAFPSTNTGYTTGLGYNSGLGFTTGVGYNTGVTSSTGVGYTSGLASTSGIGVATGINNGFLSDGMNLLGTSTGAALNPGTFLSPLNSGNTGLGNYVSPGLAGIYSSVGYLGNTTPGYTLNPGSATTAGMSTGFTSSPYLSPSFGSSSSFSSSPFVSPYGAFSGLGF